MLAHRESLPDPEARASSHYNLASALERSGTAPELAESRNHRLATFIYQLVAKLGENLKTTLHKYVFDFRQAQAAGTELSVPRVSELLAAPAFAPLAEWLIQRQVPLADIQAAVDQLHAHARKAASASANLEA